MFLMENTNAKCPIWGELYKAKRDFNREKDIYLYESMRAGGRFWMYDGTICLGCTTSNCSLELDGGTKAKLTSYIAERQNNRENPVITKDIIERVKRKKRMTVVERSNILLKYLVFDS